MLCQLAQRKITHTHTQNKLKSDINELFDALANAMSRAIVYYSILAFLTSFLYYKKTKFSIKSMKVVVKPTPPQSILINPIGPILLSHKICEHFKKNCATAIETRFLPLILILKKNIYLNLFQK